MLLQEQTLSESYQKWDKLNYDDEQLLKQLADCFVPLPIRSCSPTGPRLLIFCSFHMDENEDAEEQIDQFLNSLNEQQIKPKGIILYTSCTSSDIKEVAEERLNFYKEALQEHKLDLLFVVEKCEAPSLMDALSRMMSNIWGTMSPTHTWIMLVNQNTTLHRERVARTLHLINNASNSKSLLYVGGSNVTCLYSLTIRLPLIYAFIQWSCGEMLRMTESIVALMAWIAKVPSSAYNYVRCDDEYWDCFAPDGVLNTLCERVITDKPLGGISSPPFGELKLPTDKLYIAHLTAFLATKCGPFSNSLSMNDWLTVLKDETDDSNKKNKTVTYNYETAKKIWDQSSDDIKNRFFIPRGPPTSPEEALSLFEQITDTDDSKSVLPEAVTSVASPNVNLNIVDWSIPRTGVASTPGSPQPGGPCFLLSPTLNPTYEPQAEDEIPTDFPEEFPGALTSDLEKAFGLSSGV
eukprot:GHVL01003883.1.p1 GENE.GHVL01003883.1~~GHVL01003883.1.p1  ORF type:complete len:464 (+),score=94.25 GHVL01003883.1:93-1484(+)